MQKAYAGIKHIMIYNQTLATVSFMITSIEDLPPVLSDLLNVQPMWQTSLPESIDHDLPQFKIHRIYGYYEHCEYLMDVIEDFVESRRK